MAHAHALVKHLFVLVQVRCLRNILHMDTRTRWSAHVEKATAQKLDARRRMAERWRLGERATVERAGELLGVGLAWRRWSLDVDLADHE